MRPRSLSVVPLLALSACSSAPVEKPAVPAPTSTHVVEAAPRPPRKLNGAPVVLALRKTTTLPNVDWAWLMPEGRLVTLAEPNAKGHRAILGPNFFAGPKGAFVGLDVKGELELSVDGAVHHLGKFDQVAFDMEAKSVLVWSSAQWAVFSRAGEKILSDTMAAARPLLLPGGGVLAHTGPKKTRVLGSPSGARFEVAVRCEDVFPAAQRLLCFDASAPKGRTIAVFGLDKGAEIARFSASSGVTAKPGFAVRGDGRAIATIHDEVEVFELPEGKSKLKSKVIHRRPSGTWWRGGRAAFTADGRYLCVEEIGGTRALDTSASEFKNPSAVLQATKDARPMCLFMLRSAEPAGPGASSGQGEWEAKMVTVPVRDGFAPVPRRVTPRLRVETETVSFDQKTGALVEHSSVELADQKQWKHQAVVFDVASGAVKRVIPLGEETTPKWSGAESPWIELSDDGALARVCSARLFPEGCRIYDAATGAQQKTLFWQRSGSTRTEFNTWSGEWPDARVADVLKSLSITTDQSTKVTSWVDEGKYLTVEMDVGAGATVRLNVPDTVERVARDVGALAGGTMLGIVVQGALELWSVQPLDLRAVLVAVPGGGAAMFADGSVEAIGEGTKALGCQQEEWIAPIDQCGDVWAAKGTLAELVKSAPREKH